ncbi:hypothetical protein Tco_0547854 [Tanacetum coccineum]
MELYTRNLSWDHGSGVSDHFKQTTSLDKYTKNLAACTPVLDPWSLRLSGHDIMDYQCINQIAGKLIRESRCSQVLAPFQEFRQHNLTPSRLCGHSTKLGIEIARPFPEVFRAPEHTTNKRLVERANRSLGRKNQARLDDLKEAQRIGWGTLNYVQWAHRHHDISSNGGDTIVTNHTARNAVLLREIRHANNCWTVEVDLIK